jgi:hypothetical protein
MCEECMMEPWRVRRIITGTQLCFLRAKEYDALKRRRGKEVMNRAMPGAGDEVCEELFSTIHTALERTVKMGHAEANRSKEGRKEVTRLEREARKALGGVEGALRMMQKWAENIEDVNSKYWSGKEPVYELCKYAMWRNTMACAGVWLEYIQSALGRASGDRFDHARVETQLRKWTECGNRGSGYENPVVHYAICAFRFESCARGRDVVDVFASAIDAYDWMCIMEALEEHRYVCMRCEKNCVNDLIDNAWGHADAFTENPNGDNAFMRMKEILCAHTCGKWVYETTQKFTKN